MQLLENEKIVNVMEQVLNNVDSRLVDHGIRVAYLMYKVLEPRKLFDNKQLQNVCILAMLHDVGAYRVEEIDKMVIFETIDVWDHSVNGYLYQKYFSPHKELAPVLLFHHASCQELEVLEPKKRMLANLISLTDRADVFSLHGGSSNDFNAHIESYRDNKYLSDVVDMYLEAKIDLDTVFKDLENDKEFKKLLWDTKMSDDEVSEYATMLSAVVDFRDSRTASHTASLVAASGCLAELLDMKNAEIKKVETAALLFGLCQIVIPVSDMENPYFKVDEDSILVKKYIDAANDILEGNVSDHIAEMVKSRFNTITNMSTSACILIISNTLVNLAISPNPAENLKVLLESGKLTPKITNEAIENIDEILELISSTAYPVINQYKALVAEFSQIKDIIEAKDFDKLKESI